jgi:hypothetical protein
VTAAVLQVALALPLLVARAGEDDDDTRVETAAATSTTRRPTTTAPPAVLGVTVTTAPPPSTVAPPAAPPSTAAPPCRNSENPRCGPFRWDPPPAPNDAARTTMSHTPASPRAGEPVAFVLRATDPDAPEVRVWSGPCVDPNPGATCDTTGTATACDPHGPWTPPPERPLDRTERYTIVFPDPGVYRVTFTAQSQSHSCPKLDPYGSTDSVTLEVVVQPAR